MVDFSTNLPRLIRVSLGSAVVLGLTETKLDAEPTTAYMMTYRQEKCTANCAFCPQARTSRTRADMLSRVSWAAYRTPEVMRGIAETVNEERIMRICIQALNYPQAFADLIALVQAVSDSVNVPISVSCQPTNCENMRQLENTGVERIGISLDAATKEIFDRIKGVNAGGPYSWEKQWTLLSQAEEIFGEDRVSTHLIVGLGETEEEMVSTIQKCVDTAVLPGLFAFTPIPGTALENQAQPPIGKYRRIQVARYLILHKMARGEDMDFDKKGVITYFGINKERLLQIVQSGDAFVTSGCPNCNRPFYNEKPSGPIYNFPRELTLAELTTAEKELGLE